MGHCGSGLGPNTFDVLTPLMSWVETGTAPDALVANNASTGVVSAGLSISDGRSLQGGGSINDAANFEPYTPKHKSDIKTNNAGDYLYAPGFPQAQCTAIDTDIVCDTGKKY